MVHEKHYIKMLYMPVNTSFILLFWNFWTIVFRWSVRLEKYGFVFLSRCLCPGASRHTAAKALPWLGPEHRRLQLRSVCGHPDHHSPHRLLTVTADSQSASEQHIPASPAPACHCVQCIEGSSSRISLCMSV